MLDKLTHDAIADSGNYQLERAIEEAADALFDEELSEIVDYVKGVSQDMLVRESYRKEAAAIDAQLDELISRIAVLRVNAKW